MSSSNSDLTLKPEKTARFMTAPKLLAIGNYDSFLRSVSLVSRAFVALGTKVDICAVATRAKQISPAQIKRLGLPKQPLAHTLDSLCAPTTLEHYDIFLMALDGASLRRFFLRLERLMAKNPKAKRPLIIIVYPGIVMRYPYDGFSSRAAADFLWLNSAQDVRQYQQMCRVFEVESSNASVFGLPALLAPIRRVSLDNKSMVFFEQAVIPRSLEERRFLATQLVLLARRFPEYKILIKPRTKPAEYTLHRTKAHIVPLLEHVAGKEGSPKNMVLTYAPVEDLLATAGLCLTISSTVAIEAIAADVPTVILSDFGAHDDFGLPFFFGSGLIKSFASFDPDKLPKVAQDWREEIVVNPQERLPELAKTVIAAALEHRTTPRKLRSLIPMIFSKPHHEALRKNFSIDDIGWRRYQKAGFSSWKKAFDLWKKVFG